MAVTKVGVRDYGLDKGKAKTEISLWGVLSLVGMSTSGKRRWNE